MPYNLFWYGDIGAFDLFAKKAEMEILQRDKDMHLQGLYFKLAIVSSFSNKDKYPEKPFKEKAAQTPEEKNVLLYQKLLNLSTNFKAKKAPS